jgi:predicted metal-binding membrane protein
MAGAALLEGALKRPRLVVLSGIAGVAALAWASLLGIAADMGSAGVAIDQAMAARLDPWQAREFVAMFLMWAAMMTAMMLPSAAPTILLFATLSRNRPARGAVFTRAAAFALGYLAAWTGFSLAATAVQGALQSLALLSPMLVATSAGFGGVLFVAAGVYQWTPLKHACLRHCRSPLDFLSTHWRHGRGGAFAMGVRHGAYCLGCCWALMVLLFAVGVMNLLWIAAIAVLVAAEKVLPGGPWTARVTGAALAAAGLGLVWTALGQGFPA